MLVKICGIDNTKIVKTVLNMGADFLGVVFTPTSKRFLGIKKAMNIVEAIQKENSKPVIVFRNERFDVIEPMVKKIGNCIVQFQGKQHPDIKKLLTAFETIVAFSSHSFSEYSDSAAKKSFLMIDSEEQGSGKTFCWDNFNPPCFPWFLAGGLNASNLSRAITRLTPTGVDVSTGVESHYGKKDLQLIDAFIQAAKGVVA